MHSQNNSSAAAEFAVIGFLITNLGFGAMSVNYLLSVFAGTTIPTIQAVIAGLFLGQFTIPAAILVWCFRLIFGL